MTRAQVEQLEAQINEIVESTRPVSIRHVFYRLTDPRLPVPVEKTEAGYKQVQRRIVEMRRGGRLPYGWISDATRRGHFVNTWTDPAQFQREVAGLYRRDVWADLSTYVEVWCESRSIAGVIERDCNELAVPLYPTGGFSSLTLTHSAAETIDARVRGFEHAHVVILYVGDYDPAGVLIDQAIEDDLRQHLQVRNTPADLEFYRLAINPDQIEQYDLPTKPRKESDRRRRDIEETVEAEAMDAAVLRGLLRSEIEIYIPDGKLQALHVAERAERVNLKSLAAQLN